MAGLAEPKYVPSVKDKPGKKRQGSWRIRYTGSDGRRYSLSDKSKQNVVEAYNDELKAMALGTWLPPTERKKKRDADALTVGTWLEQWLDQRTAQGAIRASTSQAYDRAIKNRITATTAPGATALASTPLVALTKNNVNDWYDAISRHYDTPPTNRRAYVCLRAAVQAAVERDMIPANVVAVKEARKRPEPKVKELPTTEQLQAIVDNAPARYQLILALCFFHGLRIGEAQALKGEHLINTGTATKPRYVVQIRGNVQRLTNDDGRSYLNLQPPKTKAGRRDVPIFAKFNDVVQRHLDQFAPADPSDYLTRTNQGRPVLDTSLRSVIARARQAAGISANITPHYGRNWLITHMAEQGATPVEIGQLLGQSDLKTITETYMKVRPENIAAVMDRVAGTFDE